MEKSHKKKKSLWRFLSLHSRRQQMILPRQMPMFLNFITELTIINWSVMSSGIWHRVAGWKSTNEQGSACCLLSRWFLAWLILQPWWRRRYVPTKCHLIFNGLHAVISKRIVLFIATTVRTSNTIQCTASKRNIQNYRKVCTWYINTRTKSDFHRPPSHLSVYQKGTYYTGIKVFNILPVPIKDLSHNMKQFKSALKNSSLLPFILYVTRIFCIQDELKLL
jgi:hypothetical protein